MPEFKDYYRCPSNDGRFEIPAGPSLTVPDQSMSVREMVARFARGLSLDDGRVPLYEEDSELAGMYPLDFEHWDLADKEAYLDEQKARTEKLQQKVRSEQEEARKRSQSPLPAAPQPGPDPVAPTAAPAAPQYPKKTPPEGPPAGPPEAK